jgi:chromosome segregation ATPase
LQTQLAGYELQLKTADAEKLAAIREAGKISKTAQSLDRELSEALAETKGDESLQSNRGKSKDAKLRKLREKIETAQAEARKKQSLIDKNEARILELNEQIRTSQKSFEEGSVLTQGLQTQLEELGAVKTGLEQQVESQTNALKTITEQLGIITAEHNDLTGKVRELNRPIKNPAWGCQLGGVRNFPIMFRS